MLTYLCGPILLIILRVRGSQGKETLNRSILEKRSIISAPRSANGEKLIWIHGASVGEAQSALIIIEQLIKANPNLNVLVTTGTLTSAAIMEQRLPKRAFHQFYPHDHPVWVSKFLDHWQPDAVIWMESELWPNMLYSIKQRQIPAILINAHMSDKSFNLWRRVPSFSRNILSSFDKILCQTEKDKRYFDRLGAFHSLITDNIKYSAQPLTCNDKDLAIMREATKDRDIWLYASTHDGEEAIAHHIHKHLKKALPNMLTIIVPRHPERRDEIKSKCASFRLKTTFRGENKLLPNADDDIYIADTLGELGLFYSLSPIACIGRSLSNDGGGGHNPIEAGQLGCVVLHGRNVHNLQDIYDQMQAKSASWCVKDTDELSNAILTLLETPQKCAELQSAGFAYSKEKSGVIDLVMKEIEPMLNLLHDNNNENKI